MSLLPLLLSFFTIAEAASAAGSCYQAEALDSSDPVIVIESLDTACTIDLVLGMPPARSAMPAAR